MILTLTSDIHGQLPHIDEVHPCENLIIAGDVCPDHYLNHRLQGQLDWYDAVFLPWVDQLIDQRVVSGRVILTWGNHDFAAEKFNLTPHACVTPLIDTSLKVGGVKFYGIPYVTNLPRWAFNRTEEYLAEYIYPTIPTDVDVLIHHAPPFGYGDRLDTGEPVGCHALLDFLLSSSIKHVICGHIHLGYGSYIMPNGTNIYNVARLHDDYKTTNPLIALEV